MNIMKPRCLVFVLLFLALAATAQQGNRPDLVLKGDVTGAQNKTYFEVPFTVPAGVHRISVTFTTQEETSAPPWIWASPTHSAFAGKAEEIKATSPSAKRTPLRRISQGRFRQDSGI